MYKLRINLILIHIKVEARQTKRPAGLLLLYYKVFHIGINQGIIVSSMILYKSLSEYEKSIFIMIILFKVELKTNVPLGHKISFLRARQKIERAYHGYPTPPSL